MNSEQIERHDQAESLMNMEVERLLPGLIKYCCFLSQNKWDGEDIAQEAIVKAMQNYTEGKELTSALLKKIAYNHWIDMTRKRSKETLMENPELEEQYETKPAQEIAELLMKRLTPKQAVILLLKEGFQYRSHEIADLMKTNELSVKSTLHRAKRKLSGPEKDGEDSHSGQFWDKEEEERLAALIHQTFHLQDPSILIRHFPELRSLTPITNSPALHISSTYSAAPALSMAA
ncbi:sigma-70 family RNA polymerase sigma factor [Peribacillus deserti]|uniref:RNA polymerase subunit sigma n=1 Tax=Peribacillus deserti TaxID=673318 RepID=A0A2N5M8B0_9BACI|nr:sigma-70 family RNA polymerase sigma factor [Peribacillus deserti]PLT30575.1 RNA polymerase subunit sigma [Peribacillus deserti]